MFQGTELLLNFSREIKVVNSQTVQNCCILTNFSSKIENWIFFNFFREIKVENNQTLRDQHIFTNFFIISEFHGFWWLLCKQSSWLLLSLRSQGQISVHLLLWQFYWMFFLCFQASLASKIRSKFLGISFIFLHLVS